MKPRPAHLLIRKVGVRGWEVRVDQGVLDFGGIA